MIRRICASILCALLLVPALAGAESAPLVDDRGVAIANQTPQRVVSLYGSYAEAWTQAGGALVGATEDAAVSYTHLDVYKRQQEPSTGCMAGM